MSNSDTEHTDVIIIGAGLSGVGAAHHLQEQCPDRTYLILDSKPSFGGTWLEHNYPGIRSDSDMYTYGYRFKPWLGKPVAEGSTILEYLGQIIREDCINERVRYQHQVIKASWDTKQQEWHLTTRRTDTDETVMYTCNFLWMCQGYYRHGEGYTPEFDGLSDFKGQIVHPQTWRQDLDYTNKRVIVIGSGATAATLIPNMAYDCEHITMLQRSPTFIWGGENRNELGDQLRELEIPEAWIHEVLRRNALKMARDFYEATEKDPEAVKAAMIDALKPLLPEGFDMRHFTPAYLPWDQRLLYTPDGDLFKAIRDGRVTMVTDHIDRFTEKGILTQSGELLEADLIVTATGFQPCSLGDIKFVIDGKPLTYNESFTYRGIMTEGVPNMAQMFGYFRTTYTIRVEIICDFICRLLNHLHTLDASSCTPTLLPQDKDMPRLPWIEEHKYTPGYIKRALPQLPCQGNRIPWHYSGDYYIEKNLLPMVDLNEPELIYRDSSGKLLTEHSVATKTS